MTALLDTRTSRDWTKPRLIHELHKVAKRRGFAIASNESLDRMIRDWEHGRRPLAGLYLELFCEVYRASPAELGCFPDDEPPEEEQDEALALKRELFAATTADAGLVELFEQQTENIRQKDRRLGAQFLLPQSRTHVEQMESLLRHGVSPGTRQPIAAALTEAAALAGWQALDLGQYREAWQLHEVAKAAARESGNPSLLARDGSAGLRPARFRSACRGRRVDAPRARRGRPTSASADGNLAAHGGGRGLSCWRAPERGGGDACARLG